MLRGRLAGRRVDGVEVIIDGVSQGWSPPRWERLLAEQGWDRGRDGSVLFEVQIADAATPRRHADVRSALREARAAVESGIDCFAVVVTAMTSTGLHANVVTGWPVVGMAIGATEDEQVRVVEGPAWLPPPPPGYGMFTSGEKTARRHRWVIGRRRARPPRGDQPTTAER